MRSNQGDTATLPAYISRSMRRNSGIVHPPFLNITVQAIALLRQNHSFRAITLWVIQGLTILNESIF